ncbi:MAG: CPBP family intramembrane metalloprotease [Cyclobacteriaceae bacterium]|nr:CPBP family intramembrane metalloprotease [Cyclobacteriaceae bacterium]
MNNQRHKIIEIAVAVLTAIGKIIFMDILNWRLPFISIVILGWGSYILWQRKHHPDRIIQWGFRTDNWWSVSKRVLPFALLAISSFLVIGLLNNSIQWTWHIVPILLIYPLWGILQQFLVIALVAGNLQDLDEHKQRSGSIIFITSLLFAIVHYPHAWLMGGTFLLALFYGYIFLKERNIYVLGILHGWLGALFFYTVLNRDPFSEVFAKYLN